MMTFTAIGALVARLAASKIEEMIESGRAPYPVERTLLVSGILESCLESKLKGPLRLEAPYLDVRYQAGRVAVREGLRGGRAVIRSAS